MRHILAAVLLMASGLVQASPVQVGARVIEIPTPPGFARVVPEMKSVVAMSMTLTAPNNVSLALYIPEGDVATALAGDVPDMTRRYWVQTYRPALTRTFSQTQFSQMRGVIRAQQDELNERIKAVMPGLLNPALDEISEQFNPEVLIRLGGMVTLPIHHEDENSVSMSMINRIDYKSDDGSSETRISIGTYAIVNVKGQLLFLYVYGDKEDLAWTRDKAKNWISAVIAANP